jgi:hypothetical protein
LEKQKTQNRFHQKTNLLLKNLQKQVKTKQRQMLRQERKPQKQEGQKIKVNNYAVL